MTRPVASAMLIFTSPDAADLNGAVRLRAERAAGGDGRVYLLTSSVSDACGNTAFACTVSGVPHNNSDPSGALLAAQMQQAKLQCEAQGGTAPAGFVLIGQSPPIGPKQ